MKRSLPLLWLIAHACAFSAEIEFELVPALTTEPLEPVAGAPLEVRLAEDLLGPGRELQLRDADRDLVIAAQRIGEQGIARFRFDLPPDLAALVIELVVDDLVLLRWPRTGSEPVWPGDVARIDAVAFAADSDLEARYSAGRDQTQVRPCTDLPPDVDDGREALLAWLRDCPLDNAPLAERDLRGADLAGRDLHRADLRGADLSDARLAGADLSGASLLGARLDGADLSGADLEIADLGHASLFVSDLGGARLRGADLRGATLTNTNLANADLSEARLDGAVLDATDFTGAICPDGYRTQRRCDDHLSPP